MPDAKPFRLSASKLKRFLQCPRAYFLRYVQGVDEDVGGNYLVIGTAYDLHVQHYLSAGGRGVRSIDPRIVRMFDAARRYLPEPGSVEVQHRYSIPHPDGFVVEGTPDLRRPGWLGDTKTTSASGPGVGSAMTSVQLADDIQFRLYAWCEFQLGAGVAVRGVWSYVNKDTKPKAWNVDATLGEWAVLQWFDAVVRPAAAAMAALEAEADADRVRAELDACDRCWVRAACDPYSGPNSYDGVDVLLPAASLKRTRPVSPAKQSEGSMAFDLKKLSEDVDLTGVLAKSVEANLARRGGDSLGLDFDDGPVPGVEAVIPINPPSLAAEMVRTAKAVNDAIYRADHPVDHTAELEAVIELCQSAAARAAGLLARLRGGGQ